MGASTIKSRDGPGLRALGGEKIALNKWSTVERNVAQSTLIGKTSEKNAATVISAICKTTAKGEGR